MKIIVWNIAGRTEPWRWLLNSDADIALLQEAGEPPADIANQIGVDSLPWATAGASRKWRTAIVRLSDEIAVEWLEPKNLSDANSGEFAISCHGTLAAALVTPMYGETLILASMYALWDRPHASTGSGWIYADASAHRLASDLACFIGREKGHRVIAVGDLNILFGYGEGGNHYWAERYGTFFRRMEAMGLKFIGPQSPNGRCADPWPDELPRSSKNVPTYHTNHQTPAKATRQLDYVFASAGIAEGIKVVAINEPEEWGPSDHCRVMIEVMDN